MRTCGVGADDLSSSTQKATVRSTGLSVRYDGGTRLSCSLDGSARRLAQEK